MVSRRPVTATHEKLLEGTAMTIEVAPTARLLYRPREAAELLGCSRAQIYALIAEGVLPHCRLGAEIRLPGDALRRWIRDQTAQTRVSP